MKTMIRLPASQPSISLARLPINYEAAKKALAICERIDECLEWADRAAALASYAKQSQDETLLNTSMRIRARATRRCGELLQQIEPMSPSTSGRLNGKAGPVAAPPSRTSAARDAGMSDRQKKTALRVATVPEAEFDRMVDADHPATVTELAGRGTKERPRPADPALDIGDIDPKDHLAATQALGTVGRLQDFANEHDPRSVVRGCKPHDRDRLLARVTDCLTWLTKLKKELEK